jgi:drug/metabolite transporter (DMT)-like permease
MTTLLTACLSVLTSGIGQLLLRRGAMYAPTLSLGMAPDVNGWVALLNGYILGGIAAWVVSTILWIVVLSRAPLSYVYLLGSLNYIAVPLLSGWLFAEPISRAQLLGMLVIGAGVLIVLTGRDATIGV